MSRQALARQEAKKIEQAEAKELSISNANPTVVRPAERRVPRAAATPSVPRWRNDARRRRLLAAADVIAAALATTVATWGVGALWTIALLPGWVVLAKLLGLYDRDHRVIRHLTVDEMPLILVWALCGSIGVSAALSLTPTGPLTTADMAEAVALAALSGLLLRAGARSLWRRTTPVERCLVIGDGELASEVHRKLYLFSDMHLSVEAEIDPAALGSGETNGKGGLDLGELVAGYDRVIVATTWMRPETIGGLYAECRRCQVKLSVVSPLRGRALPAQRTTQVADLPVLEYNTWDVSRSSALLKRCFDMIAGAIGALILVALLPLVAVAIKLDSRGPVFFTQLRAGRGGTPFRIIKFRTMKCGAEENLADVVRLSELEEPMFKLEADPRCTRVGRLLRRISLDELPQVLNVLRSEMSIVGPRPEELELVKLYRPEHRFRLTVKPGMTGPMQVYGRGNLTFTERLAVELDYIENLSLARDLRLLALTSSAVVRRSGAY